MAKTNFFFKMSVMVVAVAVLLTSLPALARPGYAQTLQPSGNVLLVPPSSIKSGSPLACVYDYVRQGVPVKQALDQCDFSGSSMGTSEEGEVDSYLGGIDGSSTGTTVGSVSCPNGSADPQLAQIPGSDLWQEKDPGYNPMKYGPDNPPPNPREKFEDNGRREDDPWYKNSSDYQALKKDAALKWEAYLKHMLTLGDYLNGTPKEKEAWGKKATKLEKEAKDALEARDAWRPKMSEAGGSPTDPEGAQPGDYPTQGGGTAVAQPDPNAEDPCQQANQFISECNAAGWKTSPCQLFLSKLQDPNCDPMTTDPMPGEEACGGESQPDPEEVERVVTLVCSSKVNPAEPGQDPCTPVELDATVLRSDMPLKRGDVCGNPKALTTEEQCVSLGTDPKVIYMKFRKGDMEEAIKKLGGPGIIIPMPQQNPPCKEDCPQPDPGNPDSGSREPGSGPDPDLP